MIVDLILILLVNFTIKKKRQISYKNKLKEEKTLNDLFYELIIIILIYLLIY